MAAPFTVTITGGIASGKSTVASMLEQLGIVCIDADAVARLVVAPGTPALAEIIDAFGAGVLDGDGALDRGAMRERVFADAQARRALEHIVHPRVRDGIRDGLSAADSPYAVYVAPALQGFRRPAFSQRVMLVDTPADVQRTRVQDRDGSSAATAEAIIAVQASRESLLDLADDVVENAGDLHDLRAQVTPLHHRYLMLAGAGEDITA